jgi:hypothetical protein
VQIAQVITGTLHKDVHRPFMAPGMFFALLENAANIKKIAKNC